MCKIQAACTDDEQAMHVILHVVFTCAGMKASMCLSCNIPLAVWNGTAMVLVCVCPCVWWVSVCGGWVGGRACACIHILCTGFGNGNKIPTRVTSHPAFIILMDLNG